MKRLADEWASYRERVVPADAGPVQVQECRRAFYAGAQALYQVVMTGMSPGEEVTVDDERMMEALNGELRDFLADVKAGRA